MTHLHIVTIFPHILDSYINESILKRAQESGLIKISFINPRDFTDDKHHKVDDSPYGGGPGMVFKAEPVIRAVESIVPGSQFRVLMLSAGGKQFDNKMAAKLAKKNEDIILICGRYEGIDARVKKILKAEEISIGPYVLSGGELGAAVMVEAIARQIPGVLGKEESIEENRLGVGVPMYTRPEVFERRGKKHKVPKVLLSGDHKKIEDWRRKHGAVQGA